MNKGFEITPVHIALILIMVIATPIFIIQKNREKSDIKVYKPELEKIDKPGSKHNIEPAVFRRSKRGQAGSKVKEKLWGIKPYADMSTQQEEKNARIIFDEFKRNKEKYKNKTPLEIAKAIEDRLGIQGKELQATAALALARLRQEEQLKAKQVRFFLESRGYSSVIKSVEIDLIDDSAAVSVTGFKGRDKDPFDARTKRTLAGIMSLVFSRYPNIKRLNLQVYYPVYKNKLHRMTSLDALKSRYERINRHASPEEIIKQLKMPFAEK